jgi:hypothetical protein
MRWDVSSSVSNAPSKTGSRLPAALRDHLVERIRGRNISLQDLNHLRLWMETKPEVPEGFWYKDFGHSNSAAKAKYPKTFLLAGQAAAGRKRSELVIGAVKNPKIRQRERSVRQRRCLGRFSGGI